MRYFCGAIGFCVSGSSAAFTAESFTSTVRLPAWVLERSRGGEGHKEG